MNRTYFFTMSVPYVQCEQLYLQGAANVVLTADSGERVQLPAKNLRAFVGTEGIKGRFRLIIDEHNKVRSFDKVY